jgi:SAM-dependent methyltransferase
MDPAFETLYHRLEHDHWWFRGRRELVRRFSRGLSPDRSADVVDIGCASGQLVDELTSDGFRNPAGLDLSSAAVEACHDRGLVGVSQGDAVAPPFPPESFDLLIASDVLEHLANDRLALENWLRLLRPGGRLIVFVPAFQWLWSQHDVRNHHHRRYTRGQLLAALNAAGWSIERSGYWNTSLFPAVATVRLVAALLNRLRGSGATRNANSSPDTAPTESAGQLRATPAWINTVCLALLRVENLWLGAGLRLPIGVSTFAIARRPDAVDPPIRSTSESPQLATTGSV